MHETVSGVKFSICGVLTVCIFKGSGFQIFISNASVFQLIFSWSSELEHFCVVVGGDHTPGTQLRCVDHLPSPGTGHGLGQVGSLHKERKAKHQ